LAAGTRDSQQEAATPPGFPTVGMILLPYACMPFFVSHASGQLAANQTHAFGNGRLLTFTYQQNFDCVDQPTLDLDFNGIPAESDPNEMQTPICQPITEPTAAPTAGSTKHRAHTSGAVRIFWGENHHDPIDAVACPRGGGPGELCGPERGAKLIAVFAAVPEAWRTPVNPAITTQCPDPNNPVPGTCTM